jgi:acylphosphatase
MTPAMLLVTIRGRVQGVGYRAWIEHQATSARLDGWVRNRRDGSVEALFAGPARAVADLVALCRHGPPAARVTEVLTEPAAADQLDLRHPGERFSVLPTA